MTLFAGLAWLSLLALAPSDPAPDPRIEIAFRAAYAIPFGGVGSTGGASLGTLRLGNVVDRSIPLIVDGSYRLSPRFSARLLLQYAFVALDSNPTENCSVNVDCSGYDVAVAVEGVFRPVPGRRVVPWLGLGGGYEWFGGSVSSAFGGESFAMRGLVLLGEAGVGYRTNALLTVGPYVALTLGRYGAWSGSEWTTAARDDSSGSFSSPALHEWFQLGVRVSFSVD